MKLKSIVFLTFIVLALFFSTSISGNTDRDIIIDPYQPITHAMMTDYLLALEEEFPGLISVSSIGKSVDGRDLTLVKLGKGDTLFHINGSFHARERITTNIILKNIEEYAHAYYTNSTIEDYNVRDLLDQVSIYFVPMVNPDGVDYTILGKSSIATAEAREAFGKVKVNPNSGWWTPGLRWKANIRGVDLNLQWDFDWKHPVPRDIGVPTDAYFKGFAPHTEPEVLAVETLTINYPFLMHIAYHTQGREIYWYKYQEGQDLRDAKDVTRKIAQHTGFTPKPALHNIPSDFKTFGGYADWTVAEFSKIGITMEFAYRQYSEKNFDEIYRPARSLPLLLAQEVLRLEPQYTTSVWVNDLLVQRFKDPEEAFAFVNKYLVEDAHIVITQDHLVVFEQHPKPYLEEHLIKLTTPDRVNPMDDITLLEAIGDEASFVEFVDIKQNQNNEPMEFSFTSHVLLFEGQPLIPLRSTLEVLNMNVLWHDELHLITAQDERNILVYDSKQNTTYFNDHPVDMSNPIVVHRGVSYISIPFLQQYFNLQIQYEETRDVI